MAENGSPKPEFETDDARSYFISRLFIHERFADALKEKPKKSRKGAERKQSILEMLTKNPQMTQIQLVDELKLTRKQIQKDIKEFRMVAG